MAKISAHGTELARYLNSRGVLCSVRSDGVTLGKTLNHPTWMLYRRKKADVPLAQWMERKLAGVAALPSWQRNVKSMPTLRDLQEWMEDGVCESLTGDMVEPDGHGPDGAPSWLLALGMI